MRELTSHTDELLVTIHIFAVFVCYPAAFCQLCFYNKDWIGLDWIVCQPA